MKYTGWQGNTATCLSELSHKPVNEDENCRCVTALLLSQSTEHWALKETKWFMIMNDEVDRENIKFIGKRKSDPICISINTYK